uniref:(northern house mosquito) hypothetical protein n=1 Tax=Culex pipiens TaxID=7175 RepID=A0A8D8BB88_CULPI
MFSGWMTPLQQTTLALSPWLNLTCFFSSNEFCRPNVDGDLTCWVIVGATPRADPLICVSSGISVQLVCGHIIGLSIDFPGGRQVAAGGLYWMLTELTYESSSAPPRPALYSWYCDITHRRQ